MAVGGRVDFVVDDTSTAFVGRGEKCEVCKMTHSDGYCSQCDIHVCQICFDNHLISRLCRDHVMVQDSEDGNKHCDAIHFELCKEHTKREVNVYCPEHRCCACKECIRLYHKSCKWEYIIKASENFQSSGELTRLLEEVQSIGYTLDTYLEDIETHTESAEALNAEVVSDIDSFADSVVEYVATSKQQVLEDATEREETHQQRVNTMKADIQSLRSQVEEISTGILNEELLHKRFILAVKTMEKVSLIRREVASIDCNNVITNYTFRPNNLLRRMMSNPLPLGRLIFAENGNEDEDDIGINTDHERNQSLQKQLDANQNEVSKLRKDLDDVKQNYKNVVEENKRLKREISTLKNSNQPCTSQLTRETEHHTVPGADKTMTVCGTITCDQPEGIFTSHIDSWNNIVMEYTFPGGTQTEANRNPGKPYSGKTDKTFLCNDAEGKAVFSMMKLAFDRRCLFTVDDRGNIQCGVEQWQSHCHRESRWHQKPIYQGVLARVRRQLEMMGACSSSQ